MRPAGKMLTEHGHQPNLLASISYHNLFNLSAQAFARL
jgi:hypothetical protein